MPGQKVWGFNPNAGGRKIPDSIRRDVAKRIQLVAQEHFSGAYSQLDIRDPPAALYYCTVLVMVHL